MKKTTWVVAGALLAAAAGAAIWWSQRDQQAAPLYRTVKVERGSLTGAVAASGTITPVASVQVGSQVSGQLSDVLVDFNSEVKAGQVIARIDPETFRHRVGQAQADLDAARAQVLVQESNVNARRADIARIEVNIAESQRDFDRKQELTAKGFISTAERDRALSVLRAQQQELVTAKASLEVARSQVRNSEAIVKQREAALAAANVDLARTVIRSPVDGIVIKRSIEAGQTVAASLQAPELFVIARNLRDMQVDTSIDESDIGRVRPGQKASFTVDAFPGRSFEGTVTQVRKAAQTVQNVVTYIVVVTFRNLDGSLLPGMTANVRLVTETREGVLKVPNAALRFRPPADTPVASAPAGQGGTAASGGQPAVGAPAPAPEAGAAAPQAGQGGGLLRAFRERIDRELSPDDRQKQQLDAIFDGARERFAALRTTPEEQRAKVSQQLRADLRARIAEVLTPEQRARFEAIVAEQAGRAATAGRGQLHVLENGRLKRIDARTGVSDGTATEVAGPGIEEGVEVVVGLQSLAGKPAAPAFPRLF